MEGGVGGVSPEEMIFSQVLYSLFRPFLEPSRLCPPACVRCGAHPGNMFGSLTNSSHSEMVTLNSRLALMALLLVPPLLLELLSGCRAPRIYRHLSCTGDGWGPRR